jgi:PAS domain S-box-containing protein
LRNITLITLVSVSLLGVVIAILLSRRISKPINQLARSADALREGDLTTPLTTSSKLQEISQLTNALEDARVSLQHSLTQLRKEKAWIEDLLDSIVEGLLTIDDNARITYASQSIGGIIGTEPSGILGRSIDDYFIATTGEELFSHQIPAPNQNRRIPVMMNGKEILLSISTSEFVPPEAGNATRALVIRDVTDEERIHRLIGEFMANITHEFRTPLSALSASVELLIEQLPTLTAPEIEQLLNSLNIGIVNLQALIDNLIEAASIEAGRFKVNPKPVELNLIIQDAVDTIQPIAEKHHVKITPPRNRQAFLVMADRRRTAQALLNLLSNAIKHSPESSTVTLRTLILGKQVMLEVQDQGKGISTDIQSHLFNRFIAPESEEEQAELGLGLGLSVVKAIIEAQHGNVGFKNSDDEGAIFWFTLPMVEEAAP